MSQARVRLGECAIRDLARIRSSGSRELQKVLAQIRAQVRLGRSIIENAAKLFSRAQNLSSLMNPPTRIRCREIEKFERAVNSAAGAIGPPLGMSAKCTLDFTADVAKLLHER